MLHSPNMMLSFAGPLPVECGGGRRPGRLAPAPQDSSTVEAFLPRTVLTQNLCSCVQQRDSDTCCRMMSFSRIFHVTPWTSFSTLQDLRTRMALQRRTFAHTSIPIHPCVLLKQLKSKILNSPNMTPSFACPLPVQCGGGRRPGSLADAPQEWSTSEAFLPRTVLT